MLVSVIIPVYNVRPYISRCMDSVLAQTYNNLEIIMVDDGSTDGSDEICDSYAELDTRVKVIHKKNGGHVSAKKKGLEFASGEYIGYVDPDDWIDLDMYESLMNDALDNQADFVACGYVWENGEQSILNHNQIPAGCYFGKDLAEKVYKKMFSSRPGQYLDGISSSGCCKLIRRDLLLKYQMQVDDRLVLHNDVAHVYPCALEASKICIVDNCYYHYRMRSDSIMRTRRTDGQLQIELLRRHLEQPFAKGDPTGILTKQLKKFLMKCAINDITEQYDVSIGSMYLFPFDKIQKGSNIVLWGAGAVGQAYFYQASQYCQIALWVDSYYKQAANKGLPVLSPDSICKLPLYDMVVIAANREDVSESIKQDLNRMGVQQDKILWEKPVFIEQGFFLLDN